MQGFAEENVKDGCREQVSRGGLDGGEGCNIDTKIFPKIHCPSLGERAATTLQYMYYA